MAAKMTYYRVDGISGDVFMFELSVIRETPRGVWVQLPHSSTTRFVLADARKRYAWPTKEEAIDSFLARKRRQIRVLNGQIQRVRLQREAAETRRAELLERGYLGVPIPLSLGAD
jgi:hypothetical protein